jgi:hypothetical protein
VLGKAAFPGHLWLRRDDGFELPEAPHSHRRLPYRLCVKFYLYLETSKSPVVEA